MKGTVLFKPNADLIPYMTDVHYVLINYDENTIVSVKKTSSGEEVFRKRIDQYEDRTLLFIHTNFSQVLDEKERQAAMMLYFL